VMYVTIATLKWSASPSIDLNGTLSRTTILLAKHWSLNSIEIDPLTTKHCIEYWNRMSDFCLIQSVKISTTVKLV
jgi:hypothetical protein